MEIKIKESFNEDGIIISDDHLDNNNFVDVVVKDDDNMLEVTVPIVELLSAVNAFYKKKVMDDLRNSNLERLERGSGDLNNDI